MVWEAAAAAGKQWSSCKLDDTCTLILQFQSSQQYQVDAVLEYLCSSILELFQRYALVNACF
jgi:hypothetical protein